MRPACSTTGKRQNFATGPWRQHLPLHRNHSAHRTPNAEVSPGSRPVQFTPCLQDRRKLAVKRDGSSDAQSCFWWAHRCIDHCRLKFRLRLGPVVAGLSSGGRSLERSRSRHHDRRNCTTGVSAPARLCRTRRRVLCGASAGVGSRLGLGVPPPHRLRVTPARCRAIPCGTFL